ncbi:MAG: hypothetical protein ABL958_15650 [Bdellovibrionia bacterium]
MTATPSFASIVFERGFAVVNSQAQREISDWSDDTLVYCPSYCLVLKDGVFEQISVSGFGKLGQIRRLAPREIAAVASATPAATEVPKPTEIPNAEKVADEDFARLNLKPPYPIPGIVFLYAQSVKVPLAPTLPCTSTCEIIITDHRGRVSRATFDPGKSPAIWVEAQNGDSGTIAWTLKDGDKTVNGTFEVRQFSEGAIRDLLQKRKSFEIMENVIR